MPLIIMVGIPCSGKSRRAGEIEKYLVETHKAAVVVVNEEALKIDKNEGYKGRWSASYPHDVVRLNERKDDQGFDQVDSGKILR
jgi:tRNA uridine 5-carbamoylmethylation protein Kti12